MDGQGQVPSSHSWANAENFLRKISLFGASGCQTLMLKWFKFDFLPRLRTRLRCGSLWRSPNSLAVFKGPTSKRKKVKEEAGKGEEQQRRLGEENGRGGRISHNHFGTGGVTSRNLHVTSHDAGMTIWLQRLGVPPSNNLGKQKRPKLVAISDNSRLRSRISAKRITVFS